MVPPRKEEEEEEEEGVNFYSGRPPCNDSFF